MKKLFFFSAFILAFCAQANHIETAWMTYRYTGDSTGIPNQYQITLHIYRSISGSSFTQTIQANSSCGNYTVNLSFSQVKPFNRDIENCASISMDSTSSFVEENIYKGYVILPNCSDWKLSWTTVARPPFDNIQNSYNYYAETNLNNNPRPNSSALALNPHPKVLCANQTFVWPRNYTDIDGDSIHIVPTAIKHSTTGNIPFDSTFNASMPLPLDSIVGYNVNPKNGNITFKPTQIGNYVVAFQVTEWKIDTTFAMWYIANSHYEETTLRVVANCSNAPFQELSSADTLYVKTCDSNKVYLKTSTPVYNTSVNIGDFWVINKNGVPNPVIGVDPIGSNLFTDSIEVTVFYPLQNDSIYTVLQRIGSDGNTLIGECGEEYIFNDSTFYKYNYCHQVSITEEKITANIYPNPAKNTLNIEFKNNTIYNYTLIDLSGKTLLKGSNNSQTQLNISSLKAGYYILHLEQNGNFISKPILIK